jgi:hypothetical protein
MRVNNHKTKKKIQEEKNIFWEKEYQANATRKVDISGLEYITIPLDLLPFAETSDEELLSLQKTIKTLAQQKILNLTGISNTDLKLKYGVANITSLSEYDSNFTLLIHTIYKWGEYLYNHNQISDAVKLLEFGIQCKTDISKNYILLATIYKDTNAAQKIDDLIHVAETLSTLMKDNIINSLKEIKLSSYLE